MGLFIKLGFSDGHKYKKKLQHKGEIRTMKNTEILNIEKELQEKPHLKEFMKNAMEMKAEDIRKLTEILKKK